MDTQEPEVAHGSGNGKKEDARNDSNENTYPKTTSMSPVEGRVMSPPQGPAPSPSYPVPNRSISGDYTNYFVGYIHKSIGEAMMQRPQPERTSSGIPQSLQAALEDTGRTRGSAATPIISPAPNRAFQSQIDSLNNASINQRNFSNMSSGPGPFVSTWNLNQGLHNRNASSSTQRSGVSGSGQNQNQGHAKQPHNRQNSSSSHQSSSSYQSPARSRPTPAQMIPQITVSQVSVELQARLFEIQQIARASAIPKHIQDTLIAELRKVGQDFNEQQRILQQDFERANFERAELQGQLHEARRQLGRTVRDRDGLQKKVNELGLCEKRSSERLAEIERRWKSVNDDLKRQIANQEEQLKGKRALWLASNPGSSARRDAMTAVRDPFNSPTASKTSEFGAGQMSNKGSSSGPSPLHIAFASPPQIAIPTRPSNRVSGPRRRGNLPTARAQPANDFPSTFNWGSNNSKVFNTEPGDTPLSMALVLRQDPEAQVWMYQGEITKLFSLIEGWVKTYASVPNLTNDSAIARSNDILWAYMMNCTYPGHRQDSHTHVMALLSEARTRFWFVMRMACQYCVKDMMSLEAFLGFSIPVDNRLNEAKLKLLERGLANEARQQYVDQQSRAVQSIVSSPNYQAYRANRLSLHTKRLRDMLGPMLNDGAPRSQAGKDLGAIAVTAWELSVKMWTAHITFQVYFPETAGKFSQASMIAKDQPSVDSIQLQVQQTRLKLVITPVITLRDDRGTTIIVKNLHPSHVLTMG